MTNFITNLNDFKNIILGKRTNELDLYYQSPNPNTTINQDQSDDKIFIFYFTATWCKPCQQITPFFNNLEQKYQESCFFYKIDVDNGSEIAEYCQISKIPTFIIYFKQKIIDTISADIQKVENDIQKILLVINKNKLSQQKKISSNSNIEQLNSLSQWDQTSPNTFLNNFDRQTSLSYSGSPLDWPDYNHQSQSTSNSRNIG